MKFYTEVKKKKKNVIHTSIHPIQGHGGWSPSWHKVRCIQIHTYGQLRIISCTLREHVAWENTEKANRLRPRPTLLLR